MRALLFFSGILLLLIQLQACTADEIPEPTTALEEACDTLPAAYNDAVKTVLENNCTLSGCHGSGALNGDFSSYGNLQGYEASIHARTVVQQNMPPSGSLSEEELQILECWKAAGYPEN